MGSVAEGRLVRKRLTSTASAWRDLMKRSMRTLPSPAARRTHEHPAGGRVCVKAYGLIQKTYNPDRIKSPMKRTNPNKGRNYRIISSPIVAGS